MKQIVSTIRPATGFSHIAHIGLQLLFPLIIFVLIRMNLSLMLPIAIVLLSKWRMFAVRPRFWLINIRANIVDIMVGLSVVLFMASTDSGVTQTIWAVLYALWLIYLKPGSSVLMVSAQSMVAYLLGMSALFAVFPRDAPLALYALFVGLISYFTACHFFGSFDEPYTRFLAYTWAFIGVALTWVLGHWLLFYGPVAQPTLLLVVFGYGLAGMYYFDHHDKLSRIIKLELVFIMVAIAVINVVALLLSTRDNTII